MNVVAIIQARMGSKRLPGKVMMPIGGKPMVKHVIDQAKWICGVDKVVIATTNLPEDDCIDALHSHTYRGDSEDVLSRYYNAALKFKADVIVRLTGDCPLINPAVSGKVINAFFQDNKDGRYTSNVVKRTYPKGLDTEVFSFETLAQAWEEAPIHHQEHVTSWILANPDVYQPRNVASECSYDLMNLSVDTQEDLDRVRCIYESIICQ